MKESTGSVASIYLVIFFIVILFGFIASIFNYYKSYKIVNAITATIEDYAGFNAASLSEIEKRLDSYGYKRLNSIKCDAAGLVAISGSGIEIRTADDGTENRGYEGFCVNIKNAKDDSSTIGDCDYYYYEVKTAMGIDFSFGFGITIPIKARTDSLYNGYGKNCE